uniref:CBM20 domain-containing protein n=1 Tax=Aegilops tauschii subsp. strangulata TaxID=200361 RepID=A0A453FYJ7_AEGTS
MAIRRPILTACLPSPDHANTVRVTFVLEKKCAFGQRFLVVGDDPALGLWDPAKATALDWSAGHVWTARAVISPPIPSPNQPLTFFHSHHLWSGLGFASEQAGRVQVLAAGPLRPRPLAARRQQGSAGNRGLQRVGRVRRLGRRRVPGSVGGGITSADRSGGDRRAAAGR